MADAAAERLREWLELEANVGSTYYRPASELYEVYTNARAVYWEWKEKPGPEMLERLKRAERILSDVCVDVKRRKELLQATLLSPTNK